MSGVDYQVHRLVDVKGRRGMKIPDYSNPKEYIRISCTDGTAFIQKGKVMYEDGEQIPTSKMPEWLLTEIKKCDPVRLRACGFNVEPILKELEAEKKAKSQVRQQAKKEAAKAAAKAAAKRANKPQRGRKQDLPDEEAPEPEPEDVGLEEETEEDADK